MAKTITVNLDHEYESPHGGSRTVRKALEWAESHTGTENEEGETTGQKGPEDLICYAVLRLMALARDNTRHSKGEAPARIYTPRVDVKDAPEQATKVKAAAAERFAEMLGVEIAKPEPAPRK